MEFPALWNARICSRCYLRMLSRVSYPQLEISNRTGKIQYKTQRKFMEVYPKAAFKSVVYIYIHIYIYAADFWALSASYLLEKGLR